jgi:hypothetical protein
MIPDREIQLVTAFVLPAKRERFVDFVSSLKRRPKFVRELSHFQDFDPACMLRLSEHTDTASELTRALKLLGAGDDCYIISAARELDGATKPLVDTIERVFSIAEGTIVCCVPGHLAYFEGEGRNNRFILHRRAG